MGTKDVDFGSGVAGLFKDIFLVATGLVSIVGEDFMVIILLLRVVGANV